MDRRVGTKEFGAESWDRGSVRSLPEVGPQSSDLRVGTRELGPELGSESWDRTPESWDHSLPAFSVAGADDVRRTTSAERYSGGPLTEEPFGPEVVGLRKIPGRRQRRAEAAS